MNHWNEGHVKFDKETSHEHNYKFCLKHFLCANNLNMTAQDSNVEHPKYKTGVLTTQP